MSTNPQPSNPQTEIIGLSRYEKNLEQRMMKVMFEHGLDQSRFLAHIKDDEMVEWAPDALMDFFETQYASHQTELDNMSPMNPKYFELLGIESDKAKSFADDYQECERCGWLPMELLFWYYDSLAHSEAVKYRRETSDEPGKSENELKHDQCYDKNEDTILTSVPGSEVTIHITGRSSEVFGVPPLLPKEIIKYSKLPEGPEYFYYTTTLARAISVAMVGPLSGFKLCYRPSDFHGGFRLDKNPEPAMEWARKSFSMTKEQSVILVYQVSEAERESWAELKLRRDTVWARTVTAFRTKLYHLIDVGTLLHDYDVISGPIAKNVYEVAKHKATPVPLENYEQLCFLFPRLAISLKHSLVGFHVVDNNI